ncbi:hypothetical protein MATR_29000 [Marivirga tractuosa]|uniref:Lipoprotein n=1 Tax=Marivirga tractuosa (strain ATCC 23168 / DSM 4126 / NBRC 15989 / NCIMB 1408 / VKM B-1430 / H-43) TaxID=643867 RepID=E4TW33_MARTH|nr:hypothetical protein [Marivirga tractuosa]ADR23251.1 hypothetical protein Ftrac_3277 [Marivirga tractuosa DSM 4126]BDD16075.1 hypothetical protein MATR_29000 [Marivirga tractuosa]
MKKNIYLLLILGITLFASCEEVPPVEPDVNNITVNNDVKDSLNIAEQLDVLNRAGEFYNVNMKILDGTTPIEGAEVKLTSSLDGELIELTELSDESGNVIFDEVTVGGNIIEIKKEGYYSALGLIDFKFERGYNYEVIEDVVAPITKNESAIIPLYNKGNGANTAKIKGRVNIETNLTNTTSEVVKDQIIRADFSGNIVNVSEGLSFSEYSLNVEGGLGEAVTNEAGEYELVIPTGNEGVSVDLMIPQLQLKQKLAYFDPETEEPTLDSVLTTFGYNEQVSNVPYVRGIKTVVPEPSTPGKGFQINNFTKAGRKLFDNLPSYQDEINSSENNQELGGLLFSFTAGLGYNSVPDVVVTDPTGEGAELKPIAEYAIQSITLDSSAQYSPNYYVDYYIRAYYASECCIQSYSIYSNSVLTDENGRITQDQLEQSLSYAFQNRNWFGENYHALYNNYEIDSMTINFDQWNVDAESEATIVYDTKISSLKIVNLGENYTNPTISFEGGNPEEAAEFEILEFRTQWEFDLDNSANSAPYTAIPNVVFEYLENDVYKTSTLVVPHDQGYSTMSDVIESRNGEIKFQDDRNYRTRFYSLEAPIAYVTEPIHTKADIYFQINNGSLEYNYNYNTKLGNGYSEKFNIEILPQFDEMPGTGAEIQIIGGSQKGDEYQWGGNFILKNKGEGYVDNVNRIAPRDFSLSYNSSDLFLKSQDEIIIDIDYGTGRR